MATAVAQREERMKTILMGSSAREEIVRALPSHVPVERFQRVLMTSVIHDERLANADPLKVIKAALKVAPLGLLTDPMLGEAYLIADSKGEVQVRIGYRGLIKLARQSQQIASIYAHEVCENDEIECILGDQKKLHHKPLLFGARGAVVGYYAVVKFTNGETDFEPMTVEDIERIRDRSDGWRAFVAKKIKDTPWHSSFDEMAKKTVLRRLLKRMPASADLSDALRHEAEIDQREYSGIEQAPTSKRISAKPAEIPAYVEVFDQFGEEFQLQPGEVEPWLAARVAECSSEELEALAANNPGLGVPSADVPASEAEPERVEPQEEKGETSSQRIARIATELKAAPDPQAAQDIWSLNQEFLNELATGRPKAVEHYDRLKDLFFDRLAQFDTSAEPTTEDA